MIQWMARQEVLDVMEVGYPDHPMDHVDEFLDTLEVCFPDDNMEVDFVEKVDDWMNIW
jgi:hypothetical protein